MEHKGGTNIWGEDPEHARQNGEMLFVGENYELVPACQVMVVPEGWTPGDEDDEE